MPDNPSNDPFHIHKVALRPLLHHTLYADPTHRPVCDIDILRSGFNRALQDTLKDSFNALRVLRKERRKAATVMAAFEQLH